jgi:osmoprotectant transport system substrate-binding protein
MTMRSAMAAPAATVLLLVVVLALAGCGGGDGGEGGGKPPPPPITVGTKDFTEQFILGELYRQALAAKGFQVRLKSDIGSSEIVDRALTAGSLDIYPEYTGVLLSEIAGRHREPRSSDEAYRAAKAFEEKRGFTLAAMTPFSDSNALAATPAFARRHRLRTIGDLDNVPGGAVIAAPPEFRTRFEGLAGLQRVYGLANVRVKPFKIGDQYAALDKGRVGVAAVFTTDGQLVSRRYTILRDPRRLFAFQNVAPVVRRGLLNRYPEVGRVLDSVSRRLTTKAMREMNAAAVERGEKPAAVAARFLRANGLVPPAGG